MLYSLHPWRDAMSKIIEELQNRVTEAKKRLDEATARFQGYQQVFQIAQQDHNVWTLALQAEMRDEQRRAALAAETQLSLPNTKPEAVAVVHNAPPTSTEVAEASDDSASKTDLVRDLLRHHPTGMTAIDIWKEVSTQFKHRPYLYSVLKRLRDRNEIMMRRNKKYCLRIIPIEEVKEQPIVH